MLLRALAVAAAVLFVASVAKAGPAEDAMAGIGRCAAIADNGARLGCYDRLAAGLTPPPVAAAPAETAAPPPPAPKLAEAPPPNADGKPWYDPTGWFGGESVSPAKQMHPEQFGSEKLEPVAPKPGEAAPPAPIDHITVEVTEVAYGLHGKFTLFLANGQIWQQLPGESDRVRFPTRGKVMVTIARGWLGSYDLSIGDSRRTYKVKRVK